jgi:hypothetical protein
MAPPLGDLALHPQKNVRGGVDDNYVYNCFSTLTTQDPKLQVRPDLAALWSVLFFLGPSR